MHRLRTAGDVGKKGNIWLAQLESGRVGNVGQKIKNGKIELCFVLHRLRTAGNVGKKCKIWMAQLLMRFNTGG